MNGYTAWEIPETTKDQISLIIPPKYPDFIGSHVTHVFGVEDTHPLPTETEAKVIGIADNGTSVQALVIMIGDSHFRPDGKVYHLTWSLDRSLGAKPVHSNNVIQNLGWTEIEHISIKIEPKFFTNQN